MGWVGVRICDMCGKRKENLVGRLTLMKKNPNSYSPQSTVRSWGLCKTCLNKLTAMETAGDKIKEDIEIKLDELRVKYNPTKLLK